MNVVQSRGLCMHIEFRHLRTIKAIHDTGGLARAADILNITQSALSHQIKGIEDQAGVELFVRRSKPLRLSAAGHKMLAAAEAILPQVAALEAEFVALQEGRTGRLHIAIECHACYQWLFPVLEQFRRTWTEVDLDVRPGLSFEAMTALRREEVDLVLTSDPEEGADADYTPLFDYSPVFVASDQHPLAAKPFVEAENFAGQTLIAYPVERSRLDVFKMLLEPAGVEPAEVRRVELTEMILMLVGSNRGVAVLPDWVMSQLGARKDLVTRPLTKGGVTRRMHAATRTSDTTLPFVSHFMRLARQEAVKQQRA